MKNKIRENSKKNENNEFHIFVFLVIVYLFYETISPDILGINDRYIIYIIIIPTISGLILILLYKINFLKKIFRTYENSFKNIIVTSIFFIYYTMFSYFSFGLTAKIAFDYIHKELVKKSSKQIFYCDVKQFWLKKNPRIDFYFNSEFESFRVDYPTIENYENEENKYHLKIVATKGLWNFYTLNEWTIEKK